MFILSAAFLATVAAQVPARTPTWVMNRSTIIMPVRVVSLARLFPLSTPSPHLSHATPAQRPQCNNSGFMDPDYTKSWSVVDFDWSNAKALWTKSHPMK